MSKPPKCPSGQWSVWNGTSWSECRPMPKKATGEEQSVYQPESNLNFATGKKMKHKRKKRNASGAMQLANTSITAKKAAFPLIGLAAAVFLAVIIFKKL
jgi:hypothetical protein